MMKRTRAIGLCMGVVFVMSALTATSALAALPEFVAPPGLPFTSTSKATTLETVGKVKVKCTADTNKGEVTGPNTLTMTISFTGCTSTKVAGVLCQSPNGLPGEIVTSLLFGTLGYISTEPTAVGLDLASPTGAPVATILCGALVDTVVGSVIGTVTPINKLVKPGKHLTLKFSQSKGIQKPTNFFLGPLDILESSFGGPFEPTGLKSSDAISFPAPVEVLG